jgi:hypothetical protein
VVNFIGSLRKDIIFSYSLLFRNLRWFRIVVVVVIPSVLQMVGVASLTRLVPGPEKVDDYD